MAAAEADTTALARLREPFPPSSVGKLPRTTCRDCSNAPGKVCAKHSKKECAKCGNWMTTAHIDLDYVGHAEVTDRLLSADEGWTWEPAAWDANGLPAMGRDDKGRAVSLWIRLTVGGVTRLGVGSVEPNTFDAEKQLIGDALRNAAMRFGVALDLWSKNDLESQVARDDTPEPDPEAWFKANGWADQAEHDDARQALKVLVGQIGDVEGGPAAWREWKAANGVDSSRALTKAQMTLAHRAAAALAAGADPETGEVRDPGAATTTGSGAQAAQDSPERTPSADPATATSEAPEPAERPLAAKSRTLDEAIAAVKAMDKAEVVRELGARGLSTAGNEATLRARLAATLGGATPATTSG